MPLISVSVKHGKAVVQLEMESALTILNAMEEVEQQTGVPVRSQKLIQAGKVLDPKLTLEQCKVKPGAKWMLMAAAQGQTQVSLAAGVDPLAGAVSSMSCPPAAAGSGCSSASCPGEGCTGTGEDGSVQGWQAGEWGWAIPRPFFSRSHNVGQSGFGSSSHLRSLLSA